MHDRIRLATFFALILSAPIAVLPSEALGALPDCSGAHAVPNLLWPVNHKMVDIEIAGVCGADSLLVECISQDEPLNVEGDGNTEYDGAGIGASIARVRAERAGGGNGRVYHIDFTAGNASGQCRGSVEVVVPPSRKKAATDDGPLYVSVPDPIHCGADPLNRPPIFASQPIEQAFVGEPYAYLAIAEDLDGDPVRYALGSAPLRMTIDSLWGQVDWLPEATELGAHPVEVIALDDRGGSTLQAFTIDVLAPVNQDPVISSAPPLQAIVGQRYRYPLLAEDPDGDPLSFWLDVAPSGMRISLDGLIEWTPATGQEGDHDVSARVEDARGGSASQSYLLSVPVTNAAPVITSEPQPQAVLGEPYLYQVLASDPDGDALEFSLVEAPAGMLIDSASGVIDWIPAEGQQGEHQVSILVEDPRGGSATQGFTLTVIRPNHNPAILSVPVTAARATRDYGYPVVAEDEDGDPLRYALVAAPPGMTIDADGLLSWLPTEDQVGEHEVSVLVTDGRDGTASQSFVVTVTPANRAPSAADLSLGTDEDTPIAVVLSGSDIDGDALSFSIVTPPARGTLSGTVPNLTYTPNPDFNGSDSFSFIASDGQLDSPPAVVSLTVAGVNDAPVIQSPGVIAAEDQPAVISLAGADADGDALSYRIQSPPGHGRIEGAGPEFTYVPDPDFHGSDSFTLVASDGALESPATEITLVILAVNDAPSLSPIPDTRLYADEGFSLMLAATDADGDPLKLVLAEAPAGMTLDGNGTLQWTPAADQAGTHEVRVQAIDTRGEVSEQSFSLTLSGPNGAPKIETDPPTQVAEGEIYHYTIAASDPNPDDGLTYALSLGPAGISIDPASGEITWRSTTEDPASAGQLPVESLPGENGQCRKPPDRGVFDPLVKWAWSGSEVSPDFHQIVSVPLVADVSDDNGDGLIDARDDPDVLIMTYAHTNGARVPGIIRALDGTTGREIFATAEDQLVDAAGSMAVGDIDGDGLPEIVAPSQGYGVTVFEHDGSFKWKNSELPGVLWGHSIALHDLDSDGVPEIIAGAAVLDAAGNLLWSGEGYHGFNLPGLTPISTVADVDLDGFQEIIAGAMVYAHDGSVKWQNTAVGDGFSAIANFDADPFPEIVVVSRGAVSLLDESGERLWGPVAVPGGGYGGAPTIGDVDNDGEPEIGVAGRANYVVFETDGSLRWSAVTQDFSSGVTGSTVFDFEDDGSVEVLYADEHFFRIYSGFDGFLLFETPLGNGTAAEYPVVADVDRDGHAEVLVVANQWFSATDETGVRVFEDAADAWAATRAIWNQHAYSIGNVGDDGSIPAAPVASWLTHNSYRLNTFIDRRPLDLADLRISALQLDETGDSAMLHASLDNRGLAAVEREITATFYNGAPGSGEPLGTLSIPALDAGESLSLSLPVAATDISTDVYAEVSADVEECLGENNATAAALVEVAVSDPGGLSDTQRYLLRTTNTNAAPGITSLPVIQASVGEDYRYQVTAEDPDRGDALAYALTQAPAGARIDDLTGEIRWRPSAEQLGSQAFVVQVSDLGALSDTQAFSVEVAAEPAENTAPWFVSTPVQQALVGSAYAYRASAFDPDGDPLTLTLVTAPEGMTIDPDGRVHWTPAEPGSYAVSIRAEDDAGAAGEQVFRIAVAFPNRPPEITSTPQGETTPGAAYSYQVQAEDPDADPLSFGLDQAPVGMAIDGAGLISWSTVAGSHQILIRVSDPLGNSAVQSFTLLVRAPNRAPVITSTPTGFAVAGAAYAYQLSASDPDADPLSLALAEAPPGMAIDGVGLVSWSPDAGQIGEHAVQIRVEDGRGGIAEQRYSLAVLGETLDLPPVILSVPPTQAVAGVDYDYQVRAMDPEGTALGYMLDQGPAGMSLDADRRLHWSPIEGTHPVRILVADTAGNQRAQSWTLSVAPAATNLPPEVASTPTPSARVGAAYAYQLDAADPNGDPLSFVLRQAPPGMTVDASGLISWTPTEPGTFEIEVAIGDGESTAIQSWTLSVAAADAPLSANATLSPDTPAPGEPLVLTLAPSGQAGPVTATAIHDGRTLRFGPDAVLILQAGEALGRHEIQLDLDDGQRQTTALIEYWVFDPAAGGEPPQVSIQTPTDLAEITAPTQILAQIEDDNLARWTLYLDPLDGSAPEPLASGTDQVLGQTIATFDPTQRLNGLYRLILQAQDLGGQESSASVNLLVEGDLKIGQFSLGFEELRIPTAGIEITITRGYDSRRREQALDFGHGWSLGYQSLRVQESARAGFSWDVYESGSGLSRQRCTASNGERLVTVTMPDGTVERFAAKAEPECRSGADPYTDVNLVYEAQSGTFSTLEQLDYGLLRPVGGHLVDLAAPGEPVDPRHYRLTRRDGTVYYLDQVLGLQRIVEPGGNHIDLSADGIIHGNGQSLAFIRDTAGRIHEIRGPEGLRLGYDYDAEGNLTQVTDPNGEQTEFRYLPGHALAEIIDPRGVRAVRYEYDPDGRLIAQVDPDGHRIDLDHDLAARAETVTDRRGNATRYVYDERGNILTETNALGETITRSYDADGNTLSQTDPLGNTTRWTYDARGNRLSETDPSVTPA